MSKILAVLLLALTTGCLNTGQAQQDLAEATALLKERSASADSTQAELGEAVDAVQGALEALPGAAAKDAATLGQLFDPVSGGGGFTLAGLAAMWLGRNMTRKKQIQEATA